MIVQVITAIEAPLSLPGWSDTLVILLLAPGFPIMLIVSWAFNVTPTGLVRDKGGKESAASTGRTIEYRLSKPVSPIGGADTYWDSLFVGV